MKQSIMIVDDEPNILKCFHRIFADADFKIYTAHNAKEALLILENRKMDIVISDLRMPDVHGFLFLGIVSNMYPATTRILMTGSAYEEELLSAIDIGIAQDYITKPFKNMELIQMINSHLNRTNKDRIGKEYLS